jgi:hypothetical protein
MNLLASIGAAVMAVSLLLYLINVIVSLRAGALAGDNPWASGTLEWGTTSPPPPFNFAPQPAVAGHEPLWSPELAPPPVIGLATDKREVLVTYLLDAEPDHRYEMPGPSIWPLLAAIATTVLFIWSIFSAWGAVWGAIPVFVTLVGWFWPRAGMKPREMERVADAGRLTPTEITS